MQAKLASCRLALYLPRHTCKSIFKYYGEIEKGLEGILEGLPQEGAEDANKREDAQAASEEERVKLAKVFQQLEKNGDGDGDDQHSDNNEDSEGDRNHGHDLDVCGLDDLRSLLDPALHANEAALSPRHAEGEECSDRNAPHLNAQLISQYIQGANALQNGRVGGETIKTVSKQWLQDSLAPTTLLEGTPGSNSNSNRGRNGLEGLPLTPGGTRPGYTLPGVPELHRESSRLNGGVPPSKLVSVGSSKISTNSLDSSNPLVVSQPPSQELSASAQNKALQEHSSEGTLIQFSESAMPQGLASQAMPVAADCAIGDTSRKRLLPPISTDFGQGKGRVPEQSTNTSPSGGAEGFQDAVVPRRTLMPPAPPPRNEHEAEDEHDDATPRANAEESRGGARGKSKKLVPFSQYQSRSIGGETSV
jgi:hypothetical protein